MSNLHNNPHLELPPASPARQQQQQQPQPQHHIAPVYPQLPSQDELPSYSPYPSPQYSQPQPQQYNKQQYNQQQYNSQYSQQQQQYSSQQQHYSPQQQQYNYQQQQYNMPQPPQQFFNQPPVQQQPAYYGSMAAPNVSMPAPIQPQNSQQIANVVPVNELKTKSELVECPHCGQLVYTTLDYDAGLCTGLSIAGLFLAGCNNGLCLLPWLFPWTKDVSHQCPSCREKIATFTRLERDTRISSVF